MELDLTVIDSPPTTNKEKFFLLLLDQPLRQPLKQIKQNTECLDIYKKAFSELNNSRNSNLVCSTDPILSASLI